MITMLDSNEQVNQRAIIFKMPGYAGIVVVDFSQG